MVHPDAWITTPLYAAEAAMQPQINRQFLPLIAG